ncbi:xanthine dehydrogenase family protein molybdopterin-binding subunit [Paralimibaculum aggregatum]|uniref:Xanthine dehydrogenase family protein molybdopterin-binding subunit n=1 Tax=Paralimibaculum aggregatum TaxID=3036245 RepID=A0ABQ6LIK2_9RHOB|nr:xanthine dehydrogenase family protein molybdopterin-binding subunit [Limibaculum sp. NKW23]GMG82797.1 xanthine dehydrogenase family protein molybdopterin-binding subunit [Limibaculum sp. NKW23]
MALDKQAETAKRQFKVVGTRPNRPDGIDKVTGRARFGADAVAPGMLTGRVLRSPHAHARIVKIDASRAAALSGVKAVVTRADFPEPPAHVADVLDNCMAGAKALYDGHAVAAVAAVSPAVARRALKLIEVEYEVLAHVTDVDEAMQPGAPVLHEGRTDETVPEGFSGNVISRCEFGHGDIEAGLAKADRVVERSFRTAATHQGYIEPHACLAQMGPDGQADLWCCTQGHYMVRNTCAAILGMEVGQLRVTASEIGGGFGGKTTVFLEPVALMLSKKAGRPVKMVMSREEVLRASGPTASTSIDVRIGMTKDGRITAGDAVLRYQGGAYPGSPVGMGSMSAFAPYDLENVRTVGFDVVSNRPKQAAYRAPGAPMAAFAVESVIDELAKSLGLDPLDVRIRNAAVEGTKSSYGPTYPAIGAKATFEAAKAHPHWSAPLGENQGRGVACGFWFNFGGDTCVTLNVNLDGTVSVSEGNPDIGGSRASMSMMAAEELGIPYEQVRTIIADTGSLGQNEVTDGSRVTFAVGLATIEAARQAIRVMCARAAKIWGIDEDAVVWEDGAAKPAGPNAGQFPPMSLAEIAAVASNTGGPIAGHCEVNAEGAGVSFATHIVDTEVDPETGAVKILRYTVIQDAGKAVHPDYVEGQFQGGAVQGIGWALNEEYIYGEDGRLQNPGFLDYRVPVASDLPMIDTVILEIPNPGHPYGVRGVGETSIVPPLAAVANAVSAAAGVRLTDLPMSPPKVQAAIQAARG